MPRQLPPIEHRFKKGVPSPRHTQKGPYLLPLLKKLLAKKINFEDPETKKIIKGQVKHAIIWRLILNATQGENEAIKEILNRIDGKVLEKLEHSGKVEGQETKIIVVVPSERKEDYADRLGKVKNEVNA